MSSRPDWGETNRVGNRPGPAAGVIGLALLLVVTGLASGCKTFSARELTDPSEAVARLQSGGSLQSEVDRLAQPLIDSGDVYGLAIGVLTPDRAVHSFGYGSTGRTDRSGPPCASDIFQIGSISKLFVTAVLEALVQEGQISYADTVRSILPAEVRLSPEVAELTIYELVTHTAGFARQPAGPRQLRHFLKYLLTGRNLYSFIDRQYLYQYLGSCRLTPREKRQYEYSNLGAGLLAHLIEIKTGRTMPDLIEEKICQPLKLHDTVFFLDEQQQGRLVVGHVGDQPKFVRRGTPMPAWDMGEIMRASGALYSSLEDMMVFMKANLGLTGDPLEPRLLATQQPQLYTPAEDVAFGWLIHPMDGESLLYKHGMVSGYNAYVGMHRKTGVAVVVLCNTFNWRDKIGHNLLLRLSRAYATPHTGAISAKVGGDESVGGTAQP
jgi:CubicO group peptidase (beta-lactamase class C family)